MIIKQKFLLSSVFASLILSFSAYASEVDETQRGITIPSKYEEIGVEARPYEFEETKKSWNDLPNFTQQTIKNFSQGKRKGILLVHSLEDIMGVPDCFVREWNAHFPQDQRQIEEDNFHTIFTNQEFVNHYIPFVLAKRLIISCSVIALNDNPQYTLKSTFSPVSFIIEAQAPSIFVTSINDARTPVNYYPFKEGFSIDAYLEQQAEKRKSLEGLVRFPDITTVNNSDFYNNMNEVAIASCAKEGEVIFRPSIVGVLINQSAPLPGFDYGNAMRNNLLIEAAETFAAEHNLPLLRLNDKTPYKFNLGQAGEVVKEWSNGYTSSLNFYAWEREWFMAKPDRDLHDTLREKIEDKWDTLSEQERAETTHLKIAQEIVLNDQRLVPALSFYGSTPSILKEKKFSLTDEQLKGYGLSRN